MNALKVFDCMKQHCMGLLCLSSHRHLKSDTTERKIRVRKVKNKIIYCRTQ